MSNDFNTREVISKNFNFLRILQQDKLDKRMVEEVKRELNISRGTADKAKQDLVNANIITENLDINPNVATFIGVSISYSEIEVSVVGINGKVIPLEDILLQTKGKFEDFNGKVKFDNSISELINIFAFINELIREIQSIYSIKAVCFTFDEADIKNGSFSLAGYYAKYRWYSFFDLCKTCFGELQKDIILFLERNAMCQLVSEEFPMVKNRDYNSLSINIEQNGCFAALQSYNLLYCGHKKQSLNLSGLLDENEKKSLASNDFTNIDLMKLCVKILQSLIIPSTPENIYISGMSICQNTDWFNFLLFKKPDIFSFCMTRDYNPNIQLISNSISKGAAIMAMYLYYGWDYTCIQAF